MAVAVKSLGLPWIHEGVTCTNCRTSPISGYRYKCQTCPSHELCEKCFRLGHTQMGHKFLRIARDSKNYHPPFQVYYIVCDECGQAPIEGRRHHHRWKPNQNLCVPCFSKQPQPQAAREYEFIDDVKIQTICTTHQPVYHFHKRCGSCGVRPIIGPRFDSIKFPDYSLCLVCFDSKFISGSIKNEEFSRVERPEAARVRHIFVYSCMTCGEVPISGPAYVNQRVPEKVCCLLCYMNVPRQLQFEYSRVDPPSQLGDLPSPAVSQTTLSSLGSVRSEDYAKLAHEFELYRKEKEAKDEESKAMAKKCMELTEQLRQQQSMGRTGNSEIERIRKEKDDAVLQCAKLSDEIEKMKQEKEDDAEYATRIYVSRIEALEAQVVEAEVETRKRALSLKTLQEDCEKLKVEKEEALEFASLAKDLETSAAEKEAHAELALEHARLREEYSGFTEQFERLKRKGEEDSRQSLERLDRLVQEHAQFSGQSELEKQELKNLISSLEISKMSLETAARGSAEQYELLVTENVTLSDRISAVLEEKDELEKNCAELTEMVRKLEAESAKALESANQARSLVSISTVNEENYKSENLKLEGELQKLKRIHFTLTTEYENVTKERDDIVQEWTEKYNNIVLEFDLWKEDRAAAEKEWSTKLTDLTSQVATSKGNEEARTALAEKYARLETTYVQYRREKDLEFAEMEETLSSLQKEFHLYRTEQEGSVSVASVEKQELELEIQKLKESATQWSDLIEEFQVLVKEKEVAVKEKELHVLELDQLLKDKNSECLTLSNEVEALEKENDFLFGKLEKSEEELRICKLDQGGQLKEKESAMTRGLENQAKLSQELSALRISLAQAEATIATGEKEHAKLSEEHQNLQEELKNLEDELVGHRTLTVDLKKQRSAREREVAELMDRIQSLQSLGKAKDEPFQTGGDVELLKEIEILKEELKSAEDEKKMAEENASGLIHALQKQVEKLKKELKITGRSSSPSSSKKSEDDRVPKEEYTKLLEENKTLKEKFESVDEDFKEIYPKYKNLFQSKVTKADHERIKTELDRLKSSVPSMLTLNTKYGKCSLAAISCHGVLMDREKEQLEQGYQRSRRNLTDQDLLRQSEQFMNEAVKELDDKFLQYMDKALSVSDQEAEELFLTIQPVLDKRKKDFLPFSKAANGAGSQSGGSPWKK